MKVGDLELILVELPRAGGTQSVRRLLVRVTTDSGVEGWGEADTDWRPSELAPRRDLLLSVLAGRSVFDLEELLLLDSLAPPTLACALEIALWDVIGRIAEQPICNLLGGAYRKRVPLAARLGMTPSNETVPQARELVDLGFHVLVLSSCGHGKRDLDHLAALQEQVADRVELRFDIGGDLGADVASELCRGLRADTVQFVQDPLGSWDFAAVAALRRRCRVALCIARGIDRPSDVLALVQQQASDYVLFRPEVLGGITKTRCCTAIAEAAEVTAGLSTPPSLGITTAAMLHLAAATPALAIGNECGCHDLDDDLLVESLLPESGMLSVPQGPGLGVEVDRAKIDRYQVT
jgi:muconate cycloisomerase